MTDNLTTAPINPEGSGSVEDAAARFERLLSPEYGEKQKRSQSETAESPPEVEAKAEAEDGADDEAEETASDEVEEAPEDDEAEKSPDAPEEDAEEQDDADKVYTVKVDGKEMQVPLDELLKGYSRTADYTRKTEALAHERKSFHAEAEQVREERAQYAQLLPALAQQLQASLPQQPDPALRETDPLAYVLEKDKYEEAVGRLNAAFSELQRVQSQQTEEQLKQVQASVSEARKRLPDLIPAWKDEKAFERDRPKLREYGKKLGYSDQELDQAYDPRAVAALWKAMRYDALVASRPRPDVPLEKAIRPTPSVVAPAARSVRQSQEARKRLAQTGRIEDAAAAFRSLL
jgi:hypothetical protein